MFCAKCGQQNKSDALYCEFCGTKLEVEKKNDDMPAGGLGQRKITTSYLEEMHTTNIMEDIKNRKLDRARQGHRIKIILGFGFLAILGVFTVVGIIYLVDYLKMKQAEKEAKVDATTTEFWTDDITEEVQPIETIDGRALLIAEAEKKVVELGYSATGTFTGEVVEEERDGSYYWSEAHFGYNTNGILSAKVFKYKDQDRMILFTVDKDQSLKATLYAYIDGRLEQLSDQALSYTIDGMNVNFTISDKLAENYGTEGIVAAKFFQKEDKSYFAIESNAWFLHEEDEGVFYSSDVEKGYNADSFYNGDMAIFEITDNSLKKINVIGYHAYGIDGAGSLTTYDPITGNVSTTEQYGDLDGEKTVDEAFLSDYNSLMNQIGFSEFTSNDIISLFKTGALGEDTLWHCHWDCNTYLLEGENKVTLEVADNTTTDDISWWRLGVGSVTQDNTVETSSEGDAKKETNPSVEMFRPFLEDLRQAIRDCDNVWYYGPGITEDYATENALQGIVVTELDPDGTAFTFTDIDGDGTDELLIGSKLQGGNGNPWNTLYAVVSKTENGYWIAASGWSRSSIYYLGNGVLYGSGSGGAALHFDNIYYYDGERQEFVKDVTLVTQYDETTETPTPIYSLYAEGWTWDNNYDYKDDPNAWHGEDAKGKWDSSYSELDFEKDPLEGYKWYHLYDLE